MTRSVQIAKFARNAFMSHLRYILLCIVPAFFCPTLQAGEETYSYRRIGIEDGLSQNYITAVIRDSTGNLWIGTQKGLNKYSRDGLEVFRKDAPDGRTVQGENIYTLIEEKRSIILAGTDRGLTRYDPSTRSFKLISSDIVFSSLKSEDLIIFGGDGCVLVYDTVSGSLKRIGKDSGSQCRFTSIIQETDRVFLLAGMPGSVYRFDSESSSLTIADNLKTPRPETIFKASDGSLYISSFQDGLYRYDSTYTLRGHWTKENSSLTHNIIKRILEIDGRLLCATDGGGICFFDLKNQKFTGNISHRSGDPLSLPSGSITVLYRDIRKNLWAGTVRDGLLNISKTSVRSFRESPAVTGNKSYGLSKRCIASLYETPDHILWIGTDGGGLNSFHPSEGTFTHHGNTYGMSISSICELDRNHLLLSTFLHGIVCYSTSSGAISDFMISDSETDRTERMSGTIPLCYRIDEDKVLILGQKIYIYTPSSGTFSAPPETGSVRPPSGLRLLYSDRSRCYLANGDNTIYVLNKADNTTGIFLRMNPAVKITSLCRISGESWYVGTDHGLFRYGFSDKSPEKIDSGPFISVSCLAAEPDGRLWVCADNMLFTYEQGHFINWGEGDGFIPNEIRNLYQEQPKGNYLYLGGTNGLVAVDFRKAVMTGDVPSIFRGPVVLDGVSLPPGNGDEQFDLPPGYKSCTISILTDEKDIFRKMLFRYSITGPDTALTVTSSERRLELPQLPEGQYTIYASCLSRDGQWTPEHRIADLTIEAPGHGTGIILTAFLLTAVLLVAIRHRRKNPGTRGFRSDGSIHDDTQAPTLLPGPEPLSPAEQKFMDRLDSIILTHLSEPGLTPSFLMDKMHTGRSTFYQRVKSITGLSVNDYINELRIRRAEELLSGSDLTVGEISDMVGCTSHSHFSTLFKQTTGMTPTEYKKSPGGGK